MKKPFFPTVTKNKKSRLSKSKRIKKVKRKTKTSNRKSRQSGGEESCHFLDKHYEGLANEIWKTCVTYPQKEYLILYVTPKNVLIKSIETMQHPRFMVQVGSHAKKRKVKIDDKYVNCFLKIENDWYAIMRLFGSTLNTGYFAYTDHHKAFYRVKIPDLLSMRGDEIADNGNLRLETQAQESKSGNTLVLNPQVCVHISKSNDAHTFGLLEKFRLQKVYANAEKVGLVQQGVALLPHLIEMGMHP